MAKNRIQEKPAKWVAETKKGEILLYRASNHGASIEVRLEGETVWLDAHQMGALFGRDRTVILRHVHKIYSANELDRDSTCAKNAQVAADGKIRQVDLYSLDMIISVGYRVNSRRGTQFRIWATKVLKDHLVKGYTENTRRLQELQRSLRLVEHVLERHEVTSDEARALLRVVTDYSYALDLLDDYDHQRIPEAPVHKGQVNSVSYEEAQRIVGRLREKFGASALFGQEKDESLHSSLNAVMQTFDGKDVYPGLEEKGAHLLYFLVKNHSFVDGNKRIAAALFLWFMEKNGLLYSPDGTKWIGDMALVAITLMIAESAPRERDSVIRIVMNLISKRG